MMALRANTFIHLISLLTFGLFSGHASAVWYQGNAQLAVYGADLNAIRVVAIKNAIADASFQHGIMITAKDISLDGLLQSSKTELRSEGKIRRVEILSEEVIDDVLHVYVKVDIEPLFDCNHDNYMRALLVTQLPVLKPTQASYGAIFDLGPQVSRRVEQQLLSDELVAKVQLINQVFMPKSVLQEPTFGYISDTARYLANEYHSQFVLFGYIRDISLFEQTTKGLINDDVALRRNFTFQLYLFDAFNNKMLLNHSYHGEADWDFKATYPVDTYNSLFWRSDYGRVVLNTVNSAVIDISNTLTCQKTLGQIIHKNTQHVVINIGSEMGVAEGDRFQLIKSESVPAQNGDMFNMLTSETKHVLTVVSVDAQTAILTSDNASLFDNSHLFDLVSPLSGY
ncbi:flagellar assembly protein T N-terminal domain-containing protein [uncultured Paraglaciecola sp.]|uniref:flagellar assembly protein T N-terminal domain-containing protein n=1 Tax=uncultured Paraglaciecola sp. TaxID=1765024 RepID=UPI0030DA7F8E|tara:strand:- start:484 stop:1674 length:1191 start_codon:yes stop_codon:yes gene_type:complete